MAILGDPIIFAKAVFHANPMSRQRASRVERERAQKYRLGVRHVEDGKYIHYMYNLYNKHIYLYGRCIYTYMYIYNIFWAEIILVEEISSNTLACAMSSAPVLS